MKEYVWADVFIRERERERERGGGEGGEYSIIKQTF